MFPDVRLVRWAERRGKIVEWGNIVGLYRGQEFREVFRTEEEAIERERQVNAGESIGDDQVPIALRRERLH